MKTWFRKWLGIDYQEREINDLRGTISQVLVGLSNLTETTSKLVDSTKTNSTEIAKTAAALSVVIKNLQQEADKKTSKTKTTKKVATPKE